MSWHHQYSADFASNNVSVTCFPTTHTSACHTLRPSGMPVFFQDVILVLPASADGSQDDVRKFDKVTRATLQKVLDREGCDVVQDPITRGWVDFKAIDMQDNLLLIERSDSTPLDKRVRLLTNGDVTNVHP